MKRYELILKESECLMMTIGNHPCECFKHESNKETIKFEIEQNDKSYHIILMLNGLLFQWWCDSYRITDIDGNEVE